MIAAIIAAIAVIFLASVVNAFVISTLWGWYIVPHFNAQPLPLAIAFGIGLLTNYLIHHSYREQQGTSNQRLAYSIMLPISVLLFGWIGSFFV